MLRLAIILLPFLALFGLVLWALRNAWRNYRAGGEVGHEPIETDRDSRSRADRATSFLNYPWSQ